MKRVIGGVAALWLASASAYDAHLGMKGIPPYGLHSWTVHVCPPDKAVDCVIPIFAWADEDARDSKACNFLMPHVIDTRAKQRLVFEIADTGQQFEFDVKGIEFEEGKEDEDQRESSKAPKKHTKMLGTKSRSYVTYNVFLKYKRKTGRDQPCTEYGPTIVNRG